MSGSGPNVNNFSPNISNNDLPTSNPSKLNNKYSNTNISKSPNLKQNTNNIHSPPVTKYIVPITSELSKQERKILLDETRTLKEKQKHTPLNNFENEALKQNLGLLRGHRSLKEQNPKQTNPGYKKTKVFKPKTIHYRPSNQTIEEGAIALIESKAESMRALQDTERKKILGIFAL